MPSRLHFEKSSYHPKFEFPRDNTNDVRTYVTENHRARSHHSTPNYHTGCRKYYVTYDVRNHGTDDDKARNDRDYEYKDNTSHDVTNYN